MVSVDLVILTVRDAALQVLLVERGNAPYRGRLALPGGFVRGNEDLAQAASRELFEETGLPAEHLHLEQVQAYGQPRRDPRGRVLSVSYLAIAPDLPNPLAGSDAANAVWSRPDQVASRLAFDHGRILSDGIERARSKLEQSTLATAFCGTTFTMGDLQHVYEVVWGIRLDPRNFSRKVHNTNDFVIATGTKRILSTGRPAELYRRGSAASLWPPMLRPPH